MSFRYALYGDLTADGTHIVLVADGPATPHDTAYVAQRLAMLTPLITKIDGVDALELPLSWPAIVQLGFEFGDAWRPAGRLLAWIQEEAGRRVDEPGEELAVTLPAGLVPRPYQVSGALMISAVGSCLITDEPGTGKTITTILGLLQRVATS